jgi:hypothetical protein
VVHLAKTPNAEAKSEEPQQPTNVVDIDNKKVAEHALFIQIETTSWRMKVNDL